MYYRLGKFEDARRSVARVMKWAKDFRMDDHLTQRGENTDAEGLSVEECPQRYPDGAAGAWPL